MFANYVFEKSSALYVKKMIIWDVDNLMKNENIADFFETHEFNVIWYENDLELRINHTSEILDETKKVLLIAMPDQYIPYDVLSRFTQYFLKISELFPLLNPEVVQELKRTDKDLLVQTYAQNFTRYTHKDETRFYLEREVYSQRNVNRYLSYTTKLLKEQSDRAESYYDWFDIAKKKAQADVLAAKYGCEVQMEHVNNKFTDYVLKEFGKLAGSLSKRSPVLVSRTMEYMNESSDKFVLIVMDGMSEFDWEILQDSFKDIAYQKEAMFAMIPTTTSVSRQCLLSNKYPSQLTNPWNQSKEKAEFIDCAKKMGFQDNQVAYVRGYDSELGLFVKCGVIIINDIDDLVHGQQQGRIGMYHDIKIMLQQRKLRDLVDRLLKAGFDIYISSDHGNTLCTGTGKLMGTGVETETKSKRTIVLKDFANKEQIKEQRNLLEYPKYYLPKEYDYLICPEGQSFDSKDSMIMSHGGITIDEVVVPFIKIKAVDNNG